MSHCKTDPKRWNAVITCISDSPDHLPLNNYDVLWVLGKNLMMLSQLTCHLFIFHFFLFFYSYGINFNFEPKALLSTTLSICHLTTESLPAHKMRRHKSILKLKHIFPCTVSLFYIIRMVSCSLWHLDKITHCCSSITYPQASWSEHVSSSCTGPCSGRGMWILVWSWGLR